MTKRTSFPKDKIKILLLEGIHPAAAEHFSEAGYNARILSSAMSEEELIREIADVHLLGVRSSRRGSRACPCSTPRSAARAAWPS